MAIDIYHSRRLNFRKCVYWVRDERSSVANINEWVMETKQSGTFYAREIRSISKQANEINNVFMFDKNMITLVTEDDVENISRGCVVQYRGELWFVENTQTELHINETQFGKNNHYTTYLSLRK